VSLRLVTLDALGTLVELADPVGGLVEELAARGVVLAPAQARAGLRAEMAHYRAHHDIASDLDGLARLRDDCTEVLRAALPPAARDLEHDDLLAALLGALRFAAYPEVAEVLTGLRDAGLTLVVVSNWDVSLHGVLADTGLAPLLDGVLTSAEVGEAKPGGAMFRAALALAGATPAEALHAGDSVEHDVDGALAAGLGVVLVDRAGDAGPVPAGVRVLPSLRNLVPRAYPGGTA
jgi:putative hydrolase of the HAD superfamily